jgi:hypothetical protein
MLVHSALSVSVPVTSALYIAAKSVPTFPETPLACFAHPSKVPYQAMPSQYVCRTQSGYNICNSTTENQQFQCQTMLICCILDFCVFAPSEPILNTHLFLFFHYPPWLP